MLRTYEIFYCVNCLPHLWTEQFLLQAVCELNDCVLDFLLQLVHPLCQPLHCGVYFFSQLLLCLLCCFFCILNMVCYL